jgi:succinate dehydrogenase / fumarate reductase flavoprotein subunit
LHGSPRNQQTNIAGLFAIGECDYQYHGANRLGANSLLSCIFTGLMIGPSIDAWVKSLKGGTAAEQPASLYASARQQRQDEHDRLLARDGGGENPYLIHQQLGDVMTKAATVVRHNRDLQTAYGRVQELEERVRRCSLSDTGNWTNQNVVFTKALRDMFPLAKTILKGALARDECRGAHFKPEFAMPGIEATDPAQRRGLAEQWCDQFEASTRQWLKSTIATLGVDGEPSLTYEDVDTSLIPPRPRLYGLVGADVIEQVWKERQHSRIVAASGTTSVPVAEGNGESGASPSRGAAARAAATS